MAKPQVQFEKATKMRARLRMAIISPSGGGKTYTALKVATVLGKRVALIDTERGSASKYANEFDFDVLELASFDPKLYIEAINAAQKEGYDVLIIDSLSHAWAGKDGLLEQHDRAAKRHSNKWAAWRDVTPLHNKLIDTMLQADLHIIATMRSKVEYIVEEDDRGKMVPKKVGLAPVQRAGMEYEFDVVADMDLEHNFMVSKTRCSALDQATIKNPDGELSQKLLDWLSDGAPPQPGGDEKKAGGGQGNGNGKITRPARPEQVKKWLLDKAGKRRGGREADMPATNPQLGLAAGKLEEVWAGDEGATEKRRSLLESAFGRDSLKDLDISEVAAVLDWLVLEKDEATGDYPLNPLAASEARMILRQHMEDSGQMPFTEAEWGGDGDSVPLVDEDVPQ